jgi:hypothetical protein
LGGDKLIDVGEQQISESNFLPGVVPISVVSIM